MRTITMLCVLLVLVAMPRAYGQELGAGLGFKLLTAARSKVPMKFGTAHLGTPARIKVRILTGTGPSVEGWVNRDNCKGLRPVTDANTLLLFERELALATELWSQVANVTFLQAETDDEADVLIGYQGKPEGFAFANVQSKGTEGVQTITKSLICINPLKPLSDKPGFFDGTYHLAYTLAHELGHAIGLDHPNIPSLMNYKFPRMPYQLALSPSDVAGARYLYGKRR